MKKRAQAVLTLAVLAAGSAATAMAGTQTRQTNGFIEAINGLFQAAKRKARGYARFETMHTVLC
jgi:transposase